jgi:UDP-2,3-diacylglucosamine hydrolase
MQLSPSKKVYFASDFHLGAPTYEKSRVRERQICAWLEQIKPDCEALYLVGDIFDFWFEYKFAIPKGFVRLQGKIAEFTDAGIPVHFFTGNHDMWAFDYLPKELGVELHNEPIIATINGKKLYIGHGDGLGPGDYGYKRLKKIFKNRLVQSVFGFIHPNIGIGLADFLSKRSRAKSGHLDEVFLGEEKEWLVQYCKEELLKESIDIFVFGHRHLPIVQQVQTATYINLGDWIHYFTYGVFDGETIDLLKFEPNIEN